MRLPKGGKMKTSWPIIKLSEVLEQRVEYENIEANIKYKLVGVRLEGRGPFIREEKIGNEIGAKKLNKLYEGDFIYSRLFAWRGAFGIITESLQGAYVSNEFPTFIINRNKLYPRFLELYFNQKYIWDVVEIYCTGTTKASRNRFKEKFFLEFEIPLPPLEEQKRIVEKIDLFVKKVEDVRVLREEAIKEAEKIIKQTLEFLELEGTEIICDNISKCSIMKTGKTPPTINPFYYGNDLDWYCPKDLEYNYTGYLKESSKKLSNLSIKENKATIYEKDTILVVCIGGSLGKIGIIDKICSSNQQITGIKFNGSIWPRYAYYWMKKIYLELNENSSKTTLPIINQIKLGNLVIKYPKDINIQKQIVSYLDSLQTKIDELKKFQIESEKEIEQLIPSILDKAFKGEL